MNVAQQYIDTATDGRSPDTPVVQVAAGNEPPMFTQHFRGWDPLLTSKNTFVDPYQAKLDAAKKEQVRAVVSTTWLKLDSPQQLLVESIYPGGACTTSSTLDLTQRFIVGTISSFHLSFLRVGICYK